MNYWNEFFNSTIIVNCKSEEDVRKFFKECKNMKNDITLVSGRQLSEYNEDDFETYGSDTCFLYETLTPNNAPVFNEVIGISYCSIEWANKHKYKVVVYQ